jgi:Fe-Mn family superoxide dismutase
MFELPDLPYSEDALSPYISSRTMALHHGKHHKSYIDTLNSLLEQGDMTGESLEDIIGQTAREPSQSAVFNNAAQSWSHAFFWKSMIPGGGGNPIGKIATLISEDFGNATAFRELFCKQAAAHFGSGWIWLVVVDGVLEIVTTHDADLPLAHRQTALLICDLWEHAYYLDYQNVRADYVEAFLAHLVNWEFAEANLAVAGEFTSIIA